AARPAAARAARLFARRRGGDRRRGLRPAGAGGVHRLRLRRSAAGARAGGVADPAHPRAGAHRAGGGGARTPCRRPVQRLPAARGRLADPAAAAPAHPRRGGRERPRGPRPTPPPCRRTGGGALDPAGGGSLRRLPRRSRGLRPQGRGLPRRRPLALTIPQICSTMRRMAVHPRPAGLRPGAARRRERAVAVAGELSGRSEAELIAHVLGGADPTAEARRWSHEVARLPAWRRRSLGAAGLVAEHGVAAEPALRLAALWELADRWYPDDRPAVGSPRDAALLLDDLRTAPTERIAVL